MPPRCDDAAAVAVACRPSVPGAAAAAVLPWSVPSRAEYRTELTALPEGDVPAHLTARSGLPGARANLELVAAFADVASPALVRRLAGSADVYHRMCGVVGLGRLVVDGDEDVDTLRAHAGDPAWRVREAVAMALQRLGDADPARLREVVGTWCADPDPLVLRAAVAGVCEPRLLRDAATARAALDACHRATDALRATPDARRRDDDVRTLRQALGYCWSVAVAGDPARGLPAYAALAADDDPDVAWVAHENGRKARLRRLLDAGAPTSRSPDHRGRPAGARSRPVSA